jgi:2-polyprenyl-6-methoxyphenol hydroxylase-like FAD-dependent oxidoreductase
VITGGGIAGGALGTVMAQAGHSVLVLEKTTVYPDRVRGEWIAPWGVVETQKLALYEALVAGGGHHLKRHIGFGDDIDPEEAIAKALPMTAMLPGVPGPLCIRHPVACDVLGRLATGAGATVLRGVTRTSVAPASSPAVTFVRDGGEATVRCRLIVGADGRAGTTRQQAGIEQHRDAAHHLFTGMLVEGAEGWPDDAQTAGTEGDVNFLAFPQGNGRVRLYLGYALDRKRRFAGRDAQARFLEGFRLASVPWSEALATARAVSPCPSYPNEDTWTDEPFIEGLVLIGDAAGHNDPIIGQGLSITFRDVRIVSDLLKSTSNWAAALFKPYAEERKERMRRLRFAAKVSSVLTSEFGEEARQRRIRSRLAREADPSLQLSTAAVMVGPENVPEFAFEDAMFRRLTEV